MCRFTPVGFSPISSRLGRRVKRLHEQKLLISMNLMAKNGNQQLTRSFSKTPKQKSVSGSKTSTQPKVTVGETANVGQQAQQAGQDGASGTDHNPNHDAQINGKISRTKSSEISKSTSKGVPKADHKDVKAFLRKADISNLQTETWEGTGAEEKLLHDRLLQHGVHRRKRIDEYDEEYDRGRVKKVRAKGKSGSDLDSKVFDEFQKSRQKSGKSTLNARYKDKKAIRKSRR